MGKALQRKVFPIRTSCPGKLTTKCEDRVKTFSDIKGWRILLPRSLSRKLLEHGCHQNRGTNAVLEEKETDSRNEDVN